MHRKGGKDVMYSHDIMADPASLTRSISETVSRALSETVNATFAQAGIQPELHSFKIALKRESPLKFYSLGVRFFQSSQVSLNNSQRNSAAHNIPVNFFTGLPQANPGIKCEQACLLRRKMTKLHNSYPEDIACVLCFPRVF